LFFIVAYYVMQMRLSSANKGYLLISVSQ